MALPTAVLYDRSDAERFLADRPRAVRVLALTPNVRHAFAGTDVTVVPSSRIYGAFAHRRTLARLRRAKPVLMRGAEKAGLSASVAETLRGVFEMTGAMTARAAATLGTGPWVFPAENGWQRADDRNAALDLLLARLARTPHWQTYRRGSLSWILKAINATTATVLAGRRVVLFCNADKGLGDVVATLHRQDRKVVAVNLQPCVGTWRDTARSARGLWHAVTGKATVQLAVSPDPPSAETRAAVEAVLGSVSDPVLRRGMATLGQSAADYTMDAAALVSPLAALIGRLNPEALVTYSLRWRFEAALGEAAGQAGIPRYLISHGSHPPPQGATDAVALDGHAEGQLVSRMADAVFPQSPLADRSARRLMPNLPRTSVKPSVWGHHTANRQKTERFRVLQAGTLKSWRDHRPWIYETSDEFVDGLIALAHAFQELGPDYELVIRVRAADECSLETLHALVPQADNVTIRSTGGFLDDLARADLLVSYSSTTIEEALTARRPVLLFGGGCPYRHMVARTDPPSNADRCPVYAVDDDAALPAMIRSIRTAHADRLLTDAELAGYVWPPETTTFTSCLESLTGTWQRTAGQGAQPGQAEKTHG